jgi:hypothetical protein
VIDKDLMRADYPRNDCDVTRRDLSSAFENKDRPDSRHMAPLVAPVGLIPPSPRRTVKRDTSLLTGKKRAIGRA